MTWQCITTNAILYNTRYNTILSNKCQQYCYLQNDQVAFHEVTWNLYVLLFTSAVEQIPMKRRPFACISPIQWCTCDTAVQRYHKYLVLLCCNCKLIVMFINHRHDTNTTFFKATCCMCRQHQFIVINIKRASAGCQTSYHSRCNIMLKQFTYRMPT